MFRNTVAEAAQALNYGMRVLAIENLWGESTYYGEPLPYEGAVTYQFDRIAQWPAEVVQVNVTWGFCTEHGGYLVMVDAVRRDASSYASFTWYGPQDPAYISLAESAPTGHGRAEMLAVLELLPYLNIAPADLQGKGFVYNGSAEPWGNGEPTPANIANLPAPGETY